MSTDANLIGAIELALDNERVLFVSAWIALNGTEPARGWHVEGVSHTHARWKFERMLDVGAYLSATEMLVPDGWTWDADATAPEYGIDWQLWHSDGRKVRATAMTPALALVAVCLKAFEVAR